MNKLTCTTIEQTFPFKMQHVVEFLLYFCIIVGVMGLDITGAAMNNDELFDFYGRGRDIYLSNGRWGLALYRYIVDTGTAFWAAPLVASIFLALSWMIQLSVIRVDDWSAKIVYATVQISCLSIFHFYNYAMQIDAMAFALLLGSLALKFLCSRAFTFPRYTLSLLFLTVSIGVYQINVLFYVIILLSYLLYEIFINKKLRLKSMLMHISLPVLGVILWLGIDRYTATLADPGVSAFVNDYLSFYHSTISSIDNPFIVLLGMLHFLKLACIQSISDYMSVATLIPFLWLLHYSYKKLDSFTFLITATLLFGVWITPFSLSVVLCRNLDFEHLLFTKGISLASVWALAWKTCPFINIYEKFRMIVGIVCSIILIKACYAYSNKEQEKAHLFSQNITTLKQIEQMRENESLKQNRNIRVKLVSMHPTLNVRDWYAHLNTFIAYLGFDFVSEHDELTPAELEALKTMKGWPDVTSVRAIDDYLLVRMDRIATLNKRHYKPTKPFSGISR